MRQGSALQMVLTATKVLAIVLIFVFVFAVAHPAPVPGLQGVTHRSSPPAELKVTTAFLKPALHRFLLALVAGLFAFGGWHIVTYTAGETRDPERTIPRALLLGTLVVTACYLSLNAAYVRVLPLPQLIASQRVAADAASAVVGNWGAAIVSVLVMVSGAGALNGIILGARV